MSAEPPHGLGPRERGPRTVGPRDAHPFVVHFLVDTAVAFLAILVVGLILGIGWVALLVAAIVAGMIAAPFTRRLESRQLAARRTAATEDPRA